MKRLFVLLLWFCLASDVSAQSTASTTVPTDPDAFTRHVATRMQAALGSEARVVGPLTLDLGFARANLDRLHALCMADRDRCPGEIDQWIAGAAETKRATERPVRRQDIRIVVRPRDTVVGAEAALGGDPKKNAVLTRPFVGDVLMVAVIDGEHATRMLGESARIELGLDANAVFEAGLANLRASLPPLMQVAQPAKRGAIGYLDGEYYGPSRLLLIDTWAPMAKAQGGTLFVTSRP
jgi:hypothetical protein